MKVELFSRRTLLGRRYYFRVRAGNGKVLTQSEGYQNITDAKATVHSLKSGLPNAEVVDA